jgi:hypothetical protein
MRFRLRTTDPLSLMCSTLLISALSITAGCESGPETAEVAGVVTFNGQKVQEGTVTFYPVKGGRPATGTIQPNGTYELSTFDPGDGAILGEYKVAIEAKKVNGAAPEPKSFEEELARENASVQPTKASVTWLVPRRYSSAESSGLIATVNGGSNQIDFNLP